MYDAIIDKLLKFLNESQTSAVYPKFSGEGYKPYKIDSKNFHKITKQSNLARDKSVAFVDAGSAEIIGSANFSLNLLRANYIIYRNSKKIAFEKHNFFVFVHSTSKNNEIYYDASFFKIKSSLDFEEVSFSSFDKTLVHGINRADISSVMNVIRRFTELRLAKKICDNKSAEIIVLDGNLQGTFTNEDKYLNEIYESCTKNEVVVSALSKTTSLFTDNGDLLSVALDSISNFKSWFYYPIASISNPNHKAEMFFLKLHEKSKYVFRFDIFNEQKSKAEETINILANNCADPVFIGYPYGLVESDRTARISNSERDLLKTTFLVKLGNKSIEKYLRAADAHEVLDRISF